MKHNLVNITVSTKKGHKQETLWSMYPNRPHPCIVSSHTGGPLKWESHEGILDKYNDVQVNEPMMADTYICDLLRSDFNIDSAKGNRMDHAGYDEMKNENVNGVYRKTSFPNPGTFELRGKDLGEIRIEVGKFNSWTKDLDTKIQVRGFSTPSGAEGEFIRSEIVPHLLAYIAENKAVMRAQAIDAVKQRVQEQIDARRADLSKLEKLMGDAIAKL